MAVGARYDVLVRRFAVSCVCLLWLGGCFAEPAPPGGADGSTGAPECTEGSLGCPCGPDGACATDLACEASVSLCIDPACTPGQMLCTCVDGGCLQGLTCQEGLCREPQSGDTTAASSMTSSQDDGDGPTGDPGDDGATTLPNPTTGTEPPADTGAMTSTSSDPTGEPPTCSAMECPACFLCATDVDAPCAVAQKACDNDDDCADMLQCVKNCGPDPACASNDCCANLGWQDGVPELNDLLECVDVVCPCIGGFSC